MVFKIGFSNVRKKLTRINVENSLKDKGFNDYDLAKYYINNFKGFNIPMKSDLREDDKNSSMITRIQNNKLIISDFGFKKGMNIYNYLLEKHFNGNQKSFIHVLNMIRNDFKLTDIECLTKTKSIKKSNNPIKHNKTIKDTSLPVKIEVKRCRNSDGNIHWSTKDIKYWESFGISVEKLNEKGIAPLDTFWITNFNKDGIRTKYDVRSELCYVYPFFRNKDGFFMYKIYLPNGYRGNTEFKWISNVNKKVVQNIQNIPASGDLLIIQSSYKDIMLMETLNPELNIIAPNGEGIWFDDDIWYKLRKNWKEIILFGNNDSNKKDNPGLTFSRNHSYNYNIPFICTPDNTASDISDFYKKYGKEKTSSFINSCLEHIKLVA